MAKTKLSEFLAQHPEVSADDLIDDELDLPLPEVRKRLKVNADNYTKSQQALKERENQAAQLYGLVQQHEQYRNQLESELYGLRTQAQARAQQVQQAGGDWRRDPLFQDLAGEFDRVASAIHESRTGSSALAKALVGIAAQYQQDRRQLLDWVNRQEVREMRRQHQDFDEEKITNWAREKNVSDSWENAYQRYKAEQLPSLIDEAEKRGRESAFKDHADRFDRRETEMGNSSHPAPPVGDRPKDYKSAWSGLANEFRQAGLNT